MTDVNWSTTLLGYAVLGGATVAYFWPQINRTFFTADGKSLSAQDQPRLRRQESSTTLDGERQKPSTKSKNKAAKSRKPLQSEAPEASVTAPNAAVIEKEKDSDLDWARQMANVQKGTKLTQKSQDDRKNRSVKQSKANRTPEESVSGGDVDEDLSVAIAASLRDQEARATSAVADMLEPKAAGPSVLRVVPLEEKPKAVQENGWNVAAKSQKTKSEVKTGPAESETKKQRQHRQQAEERKAAREEGERVRQALLETQRRTAREARGEPAKNGVSVPATNSWTAGKPNQSSATIDSLAVSNGQLLDTFDAGSSSSSINGTVLSTNAQASPASHSTANTWQEHELPSEEEQMRLLQEQDESSWNTVQDKRKAKKLKNETRARASAELNASKASSLDGHDEAPAPAVQPLSTLQSTNDDGGWSVA